MNIKAVDLPLHSGSCPRWLFPRMEKLAEQIFLALDLEYGDKEILSRLSNPLWFQALGCTLGFDWHSSGLTTTTTAAIKQALNKINIGIYGAGGKGKTSRKTLQEIKEKKDKTNLSDTISDKFIKASRLSAKVDSSCLQDGFSLYHHAFFFSSKNWTVIQQGMQSPTGRYARRYHWNNINSLKFLNNPHNAVCCDKIVSPLNLSDKKSQETRKASLDIAKDFSDFKKYFTIEKNISKQQTFLSDFLNMKNSNIIKFNKKHFPELSLSYQNLKTLKNIQEYQPNTYEEMLLLKGVGAKTIRSLALISELLFGTEISWKDPVKFSFSHGGKDGWPYPINKKHFDKSIQTLKSAVENSRVKEKDKFKALKRLKNFVT
jgi:hypothetical protein